MTHPTIRPRRPHDRPQSRRIARWAALILVLCGVVLHVPDFVAARPMRFVMAGMPMSLPMATGMLLIALGLAVGGWGLKPARTAPPAGAQSARRFAALDTARMSPAHWNLFVVLTLGLIVDTMKPASLGFVVPGMAAEYRMPTGLAAVLPLTAIAGTVLGSLVWGYLADLFGRRSTILFSALMYIGTSICGFMPSFAWNLVMCFLMGAAAGGMLPTVYSLMSESMPARWRGWLVVLQSGLGSALGYLAASAAAAMLIPLLSWRVMWLLNVPTGALLFLVSRWIPESPRFLLSIGLHAQADRVMRRYGIVPVTVPGDSPAATVVTTGPGLLKRLTVLLSGPYRVRTAGVVLYGLAWGTVNWAFIIYLPTLLARSAIGGQANRLLAFSALLAAPSAVLAAASYALLGSRRSMVLYCGTTVVALACFGILRPERLGTDGPLLGLVAVLLAASGGMSAMLAPYAAEVYPTTLRATGSGIAAAATKTGGLFGPAMLSALPALGPLALAAAAPVAAAAIMLHRTGQNTSGKPLTEVAPSVPVPRTQPAAVPSQGHTVPASPTDSRHASHETESG